jgi:two-component system, LytTR family, sensor kinase
MHFCSKFILMKKKLITIILVTISFCQQILPQSTQSDIYFSWNNYVGSYTQKQKNDSTPFLVVQLPHNEKYALSDSSEPLNPTFSLIRSLYKSKLHHNYLSLFTYDSADVHFSVPYINKNNSSQYEFRFIQNGEENSATWHNINSFSNDSLQFYLFKKGFALLGGIATPWDKFITAELRKKNSDTLLSAITIYWKQVRPAILNIYTSNELNDFLLRLKEPQRLYLTAEEQRKWHDKYKTNEIDSITKLPKKLIIDSPINGLIFYLNAQIYKKEAVEYQIVHDGKTIEEWKPNNFDNNIIWLNNLTPGNFILRFRYIGQRQNISEYYFEIKPPWHQTVLFKTIFGGLIVAFFGFICILFLLKNQTRKTSIEKLKLERLNLELKMVYTQLNPHFVFNALSSIQGLINKTDIENANLYLNKFSSLMRATVSGIENEFVSLAKEINILKSYLVLEQLRFGFQFEVKVSKDLPTSEIEIPFLILQPLVENAIKHGVSSLQHQGFVCISFTKKDNDMYVNITDNGAGFDPNLSTNGFGLKLTNDRIKLLNKTLITQSISISATSNSQDGTSFQLIFYKWFI